MCLSCENVPKDICACGWMHGMQTDETRIDHTVCTDDIERVNGWRKFLQGWDCTDEAQKKIFARMRSHGWTAEENCVTQSTSLFITQKNNWSRWHLPHHVSSQLKLNMSYIIFAAKWYGDNNNIFLSKQKRGRLLSAMLICIGFSKCCNVNWNCLLKSVFYPWRCDL